MYYKTEFDKIVNLDVLKMEYFDIIGLFRSKNWMSTKFRFLFFNLKFWEKGVLIHEGSGKKIFLSVYDADELVKRFYKLRPEIVHDEKCTVA